VRRIVADNPGPMTGPGTNTYLVGIDEIVVIDPGPDDATHLDAIAGCGGDRIRWIVCTHTHIDHWPGVAGLRDRTGAEVLAFDARDGLEIDRPLADGDPIEATEFVLRAIHTPGHASNHLCYLLEQERMLFSGDHIMNGSTVVIRPPDGDMSAYLEQLERLKAWRPRLKSIAPGHGHLIEQPVAKIDEYLTHRRQREAQVLECVQSGTTRVKDIVATLYPGLIEELIPMAEATVWAHLLRLREHKKVKGKSQTGVWRAA
jgi:glyoxylase-like metal-dependent hydrolase (beta-lactamase superfamily II)